MSPTSLMFFVFVAIALILYYTVPKKLQWVVLLFASLFFISYASKFAMLYMVAVTLLIYFGAVKIQGLNDKFRENKKTLSKDDRKRLKNDIKKKQHCILTVMVIAAVGILAVLKYFNFFGETVNSLTTKNIVPFVKLAVPLGISYYTLMSVSYIVDVYRGTVEAEKNPFRLLLFVCYFPHITEGPFDTYDKLSPQFREYHKFDYDIFMNAASLLLLGLVKKMIIADRIAYIANEIFDNYTEYSGIPVIVGMVAYTVQLYFDFSGCIDIVRGVSKMFCIDIAENFNRPFFSHTIQEFWQRWHITLGAWLKNYVFYPVSLSKATKKITKNANKHIKNKYFAGVIISALPLLSVWFVMGIWHGASWKYVVYGLYYFALIMLGKIFEPLFVKIFEKSKIKRDSKLFKAFQVIRTDLLVVIGLTMFRADTLSQFATMIKSLIGINIIGIKNIVIACEDLHYLDYFLLLVMIILFMIIDYCEINGKKIYFDILQSVNKRWVWITVSIIMIILLGVYGSGYTEQPFVYADF